MAAAVDRGLSDHDICQLILAEAQSGETYQPIATGIGNLVSEMYTTFETQASQITIQERKVKENADEIGRVLDDCRTFVQQTREEANVAKASMVLEVSKPCTRNSS